MFFKIVEHIDIVSRSTPLFLEINSQKKVPKILANIYSSTRYGIHKKIFPRDRAIFLQIPGPFPFPFPHSSQERERVIPRFPFPQDLRE